MNCEIGLHLLSNGATFVCDPNETAILFSVDVEVRCFIGKNTILARLATSRVSRIKFAADRACNYGPYVSEFATGQSARRVGVATRT